jgi:hypothetical protein
VPLVFNYRYNRPHHLLDTIRRLLSTLVIFDLSWQYAEPITVRRVALVAITQIPNLYRLYPSDWFGPLD